ncbi:hypothetical protein PG985_003831 [Apiospora marii]|uniref:uncharacterized protein n=1 Tax=Apiospora marii TaxID=335849 RepID=UPI0031321F87
MASLNNFTRFEELPGEIQVKIFKEAIAQEHVTRVVPVINSTKRVVLTRDVLRDSKFIGLCKVADDVARSIYDCELQILQNNALNTIHLSSNWDIFLVSPWQFTLGINANAAMLSQSLSSLSPNDLSKVKKVMEHQLDMGELVYHATPNFDRIVYSSVDTCFVRVDHARPTPQTLTAQIGGGPHTQLDVLRYYTNPSIYEELTGLDLAQDHQEEESSGVDPEGSCE